MRDFADPGPNGFKAPPKDPATDECAAPGLRPDLGIAPAGPILGIDPAGPVLGIDPEGPVRG